MYAQAMLKIPLLLLASYCCHINATSPTPPAKKEEQAAFDAKRGMSALAAIPGRLISNGFETIFHCLTLAEIVHVFRSASGELLRSREGDVVSRALNAVQLPHTMSLLGVVLMVAGTRIRQSCYRALGGFFTFELSIKPEHKLVTDGPYAIVRHPSYAGAVIAMVGATLVHMGPGSYWVEARMWETPLGKTIGVVFGAFVVLIMSFLVARTRKEDVVLRGRFKDEWVTWTNRTQYRLIPYLY